MTQPEVRNLPLEQVASLGWRFSYTTSCTEAQTILETDRSGRWVVLVDVRLPDGTWHDLLKYVIEAGVRAEVVVRADNYDKDLWLEAARFGAFDVLAPPHSADQTRRMIDAAASSCDKYPYSI